MRSKNKILLIGFVVIVVVMVLMALYESHFGDGQLVFFSPVDSGVRGSIDGKVELEIPAKNHKKLALKQGKHVIRIETPGIVQHELNIQSGYENWAVPVLAEQCFVVLNVTLSHYGKTQGPQPLPKISKRLRHAQPFKLPKTYYLSENRLPKQIQEKLDRNGKVKDIQLVYLFETVGCTDLDLPDEQLVKKMGF